MAHSYQIPANLCPKCGAYSDRAGEADSQQDPKAGDVVVCVDCGAIQLFDEELRRVDPPSDHPAYADPVVLDLQRFIRSQRRCAMVGGSNIFPGWRCCECKTYNGQPRLQCRVCSHDRCDAGRPADA